MPAVNAGVILKAAVGELTGNVVTPVPLLVTVYCKGKFTAVVVTRTVTGSQFGACADAVAVNTASVRPIEFEMVQPEI